MTLDDYNAFCGALPHTQHVVQWGGAHVWKVGDKPTSGKVFAVAGWSQGDTLAVTFKVSPMSYELLKEQADLRPAPYLASRGMTWIQWTGPATLNAAGLKEYLRESHRLASLNLTKKLQRELGLNQD
jgi:predicted DNA-binding protein (MmcQ/YjbR family)